MELEAVTTNTPTKPPAAKVSPFGSFALALSGIPVTLSGVDLMLVAVHGHSLALFNVAVALIVAGGLLSALLGYRTGLARRPKDNEEA